jgi:hypothetical protein
MKKILLVIFIVLDLAVISLASMFLRARIKGEPFQVPMLPTALSNILPKNLPGIGQPAAVPSPQAAVPRTAPAVPAAKPAAPAAPAAPILPPNSHKILFSYKNSKPRKVMIRADFTGWKEEPMVKEGNEWKYTAILEPGEYAYCFSIDGKKPIKDPFNKRVKKVGTTFVSSIVVPPTAPAR